MVNETPFATTFKSHTHTLHISSLAAPTSLPLALSFFFLLLLLFSCFLSLFFLSCTLYRGRNPHGWGWQPSWRNQFLDNVIDQGNAWGTTTAAFASLTSDEQPGNFTGPLNRALVWRRNRVLSNAGYVFSGTLTDGVLEHCTAPVVNTVPALSINYSNNAGLLVRGLTETEGSL